MEMFVYDDEDDDDDDDTEIHYYMDFILYCSCLELS
jgi:hypothetical protein